MDLLVRGPDTARSAGGDRAESPYQLGRELGDEMTAASTVIKTEKRLLQARQKIAELRDRATRMRLSDTGLWSNQNLSYARAVVDMLVLAEALVEGGLVRKESRGSHYRTDYPERNDGEFLRTTVATWNPATGGTSISLEPVPAGLVKPRARTYGKVDAPAKPAAAARPVAP